VVTFIRQGRVSITSSGVLPDAVDIVSKILTQTGQAPETSHRDHCWAIAEIGLEEHTFKSRGCKNVTKAANGHAVHAAVLVPRHWLPWDQSAAFRQNNFLWKYEMCPGYAGDRSDVCTARCLPRRGESDHEPSRRCQYSRDLAYNRFWLRVVLEGVLGEDYIEQLTLDILKAAVGYEEVDLITIL
jgi:hypothetical protein